MFFFEYVIQLEASVPASPRIRSRSVQFRRFSDRQGRVEITIIFDDDSCLHIAQVVDLDQTEPVGKYAYHYQDSAGALIFRYDNKLHFPDLPSYPDHKHVPGAVVATGRPAIPDVVDEALARLASPQPK